MQRALGIDLGTTNSVMAQMFKGEAQIIINRENSELTPSVVARGRKGELIVGQNAKSRARIDPNNAIMSSKRFVGRNFKDQETVTAQQKIPYHVSEGMDGSVQVWMGEQSYSPTEIAAIILRRIKEDAENRLNEQFTRAVITVPAYFSEKQVAATREAGRLAGLHVLRIINEPTAAALAYGFNRIQDDETKTVLVYDLGGGTFDISIIMLMQGVFTVLGIEGDTFLGGDDFDNLLIEHFLNEIRQQHGVDFGQDLRVKAALRNSAEQVKIALSSQESTEVIIPALGSQGITLELEVDRDEFEAMIRPRLERTLELTHKAIQDAYLSPEAIDYILLVGGSTSIPLVEQMLRQVFGENKIRKNINPMLSVALGAALQTAIVSDVECLQCGQRSSVQHDDCPNCGTPLYGLEKVTCPTCFVPVSTQESSCWKCGTALATIPTPAPATASAATTNTKTPVAPTPPPMLRCPTCAKPYAPDALECVNCGEIFTSGGLRCSSCQKVNAPGVKECAYCNSPIVIITDMIPKDLGIELHDGAMAVMLPKGTIYPTTELHYRNFETPVAGMRRLEIFVYEGQERAAKDNDLCGILMVELPSGLPRGTTVAVSFGLDADRTLSVDVRMRTSSGNKQLVTVRMQRNRLSTEQQQKVQTQRDQLSIFLNRWEEDLTNAERNSLLNLLHNLDDALNRPPERRELLDQMLREAQRVGDLLFEVRGTDVGIHNFLFNMSKYIPTSEQAELQQIADDLRQARERGDWDASETLYQKGDARLAEFGPVLRMIDRTRTWVFLNRLSPALENRARAIIQEIENAFQEQDDDRLSKGIDALAAIYSELKGDAESRIQGVTVETKLAMAS